MHPDQQYRLFCTSQAQPYALALLILIAGASFILHVYAAFWLALAALMCGYIDWMLTAFFRPRLAILAAWVGVLFAVLAVAVLGQVI